MLVKDCLHYDGNKIKDKVVNIVPSTNNKNNNNKIIRR